MLRELIKILRSNDPLGEMGKHFLEMLRIVRDLTLRAGEIVFEGKGSAEERTWIYRQDVEVNKLERLIRKQVIAHLSLSGNNLDIPYCLLLISLVKDVERIGDYAKNLTEIREFFTGPLPDDELVSELKQIRDGVESSFAGVAHVLDQSDQERALMLIHEGTALAHRCDMLVTKAATSPYDASTTAAIVLAARYYKRIGGHVLNVLSSVVMPLHKIDYYDEDSIPEGVQDAALRYWLDDLAISQFKESAFDARDILVCQHPVGLDQRREHMANYVLNVPTAAQQKSMSCWHASAQMIWWYWQQKSGRQGPMWTLAQTWDANTGLAVSVKDFIRLAQRVGMKAVPRQTSYTSDDLAAMLKRYGPIWCAGTWYGFGHVIVLTGVSGDTVYINDPDRGVKKKGTVKWFNDKMMNNLDGCFMYKDPKAY